MSNAQLKSSTTAIGEDQKLKGSIIPQEETPTKNQNINDIKEILYKLERDLLIINRIDFFGNTVPIGAFCNAIAFIISGFVRCHVLNKDKIEFLEGIVLIFGGLGQITAGFLEFLKARSYSALLYLTLGFYCVSNLFVEFDNDIYDVGIGEKKEITLYIVTWFITMVPLIWASLKINLFFLIQTASTFLFFLFRWVGELSEKKGLYDYTSGIFQLIAGFASFYIFAYQIIDEELKIELLPCFPFDKENDIDYDITGPSGSTPK